MRYIYQGHFKDQSGNVVASGQITVYEANSTTLATIYDAVSGGTAVSGSVVTTDSVGFFSFYVDTDDYSNRQRFKIKLEKTGFASQTYDYLLIFPEVEDNEYNVIDYGAVATNGTTDSLAAFQAAFADAKSNGGGIIVIPPTPTGYFYYLSDEWAIENTAGSVLYNIWIYAHGAKIKSASATNAIRFGLQTAAVAGSSVAFCGMVGGHIYSLTCTSALLLDGRQTHNNTFRDLYIETESRTKGDHSQGICIVDKDLGGGSGSYQNLFDNLFIDGWDKNVSIGKDWNGVTSTAGPNLQYFRNITSLRYYTYGAYFGVSGYNEYSGNGQNASEVDATDIYLSADSSHNFIDVQLESGADSGIGIDIQLGSVDNDIRMWAGAGDYSAGADALIDRNNTSSDGTVLRQSSDNTVRWTNNGTWGNLVAFKTLRMINIRAYADQDLILRLGDTKTLKIQDNGGTELLRLDETTGNLTKGSSAEQEIKTVTFTTTLTSNEIKALAASPKSLVGGQGATKFIEFVSATLHYHGQGLVGYVEQSAPDDMVIEYTTTGTNVTADIDATGFITETNDEIRVIAPNSAITDDFYVQLNKGLQLINTGQEYITGTGTMTVYTTVRIHTIS